MKFAWPWEKASTGGLSVKEIILRDNTPFHSTRTGGTVHSLTEAQANNVAWELGVVADDLYQSMGSLFLSGRHALAYTLAHIHNESCFDPDAINPNWQDAKPGVTETPEQTFMHTDVGLAQMDGATLVGYYPGRPWSDCLHSALDLGEGASLWLRQTSSNLKQARAHVLLDSALAKAVNKNPLILGIEAYNVGFNGALARAETYPDYVESAWRYALDILERTDLYLGQLP